MTEKEPIPISWVSREDLVHCRPSFEKRIESLSDADVEYIGEKMGDYLMESYWTVMDIVLSEFFETGDAQDEIDPDIQL